jgi:hypothetical protein
MKHIVVKKVDTRLAETAKPLIPETLSFLVKVNKATGRTGRLAVGEEVFDIRKEGDSLAVYVREKRVGTLSAASVSGDDEDSESFEVSISMSDLKRILEESYRKTESIQLAEKENDKVATLEIDLDHFDRGEGFREIILPILIEEVIYAHKQRYGEKAKFIIKSKDADLSGQVVAQLNKGSDDTIAYSSEQELPKVYQDQKNRILLATPEAAGLDEKFRRFLLKAPGKGDIPNFRTAFKLAIALARLDEINAASLEDANISELLRAFIKEVDIPTFVKGVLGEVIDAGELQGVALPPIITLPIESWLQGARLATKLVQQSA